MKARILLLVPVAAVLLGGCGGPPAGTLVVDQKGDRPAQSAWYLRIETMKAKVVKEAAFPGGDISFEHELPVGRYRVISWSRPCTSDCPSSGERGLGPLKDVCGAPIEVSESVPVQATVEINTSGGCSVTTQR